MSSSSQSPRRFRIPHIKFVRGGADVIRGRWYFGLFGLYDRVEGQREDGLAINVPGLLAWSAALVVVAYFSAAALLFYLWERNPYNLLGYKDALLYPMRRAALEPPRGRAYLNQGFDLWRQKKYDAAARYLSAGLQRVPYDLTARTMLAQYYTFRHSRPLARATLADGLGPDYPGRTYLTTLCNVAEQDEDYGLIVRACEHYRAQLTSDAWSRDRRWLEAKEFAALTAAGRHEEALKLASAEAEWNGLAGEQRVLALLALQRTDEAVRVLAEWHDRPGADLRLVARLQVRAYREAGRLDDMERAIVELRRLLPNEPQAFVHEIIQRAMAGQANEARSALDDYLRQMAKSPVEMLRVAEPLEEIGALPLVERCAGAAAERNYPKENFQVLLVQAYLRGGEWTSAQRVLREMAPVPKPAVATRDSAAAQLWRDWMTTLVAATASPVDTAQLPLLEFLRSRPLPMQIFRRTIETLRLAGRLETERDAVAIAVGNFPASVWAQARRREVTDVLARANRTAAAAAGKPRWSEQAFVEQLDALLGAAKWNEAEALLGAVRELEPRPAWLERRDDRVRLAQLQIAHARGAATEMVAAARIYLNGDAGRSNTVLDLARNYYLAGDKAGALTLAKEVQRRSPDYPPLRRLLSEWQKQ